ncbi:MAG: zinc ribbon domain-containing protein [Deltaproteobacteria bacterium]|nr:zinc ribbon domain-containing protein [Deltaproteobacteria bacterium]
MPIYEYKCKKCGKEFEVFQGITDPVVKSCRFCRGPVHKMMSLSSFHLKGSGWYATDYGGKKAPGGEKKKDEAASTEKPKSESAPAAKAKTEE